MPKTMKTLQDNGKRVTTLADLDLLVAGKSPFGVSDDVVIRWGDIKAMLNLISQPLGASGALIQEKSVQTGAVATGTTQIPADDTIPQNTEGDEYMTLAITPTSATNKLRIQTTMFAASSAIAVVSAALFKNTDANALASGFMYASTAGDILQIMFTHTMDAGTTSAITFKARAGLSGSGTLTFNGSGGARKLGGVLASSIIIREEVP